MTNYEITIDENEMLKLEKLHFEYTMMQNNLAFMIDQHKNDVEFLDSPIFTAYLNKSANKLKEYQLQKDHVTTLLPKELQVETNTWQADFVNRVIVVTENK